MWKRVGYGLIVLLFLFLAALALLLIFDWWSGDTFLNSVVKGWFGFIFARLVALFLVALALRRLWRSFPRVTAWMISITALSFAAFAIVKSYAPEGTYCFVGDIEPMNEDSEHYPQ